jgi:serine/threonine protein kinase
MLGVDPELEAERSVRDRLYGRRTGGEVTVTRGQSRPPLPRRATLPPGRVVAGRYRLLELLGTGGMGTVYRAHDERLNRDVAVKLIAERIARDPPSVRRFRREAEMCARLAHPNIVAILDAGVVPRDFMVMELVHGIDSGTLLRKLGWLAPADAVQVVAQVCEALACAHAHGVVHRDVTPGNILVSRPCRTAKLADFGLASAGRGQTPVSGLASVIGTPGYVAPEILRGAGPSPRSDLYSLGVVAYRFLAGPVRRRRDDQVTAPQACAVARMHPLAEARPDLPGALANAVQQALADDPDDRQDSVAEFRAQLLD